MNHYKSKNYILSILLFFLGCSTKENLKIEYYSNGDIQKIYTIKNNEKNTQEILFYPNGNINKITNYADGFKEGEELNFFENNGLLESKLIFKKNIPNGVAYWFYQSGALRASRNYVNGKEYDMGFDYWDYGFVINKSLERFDNDGKVIYKLNFDSSGKPTNSEGDSLRSGIKSVK